MRFLLTNDDGIDAPGLATLEEAAAALGEFVIVAPHEGHSGCGHRVTTHADLTIDGRGAERWAVQGTPGDCVRLALHALAPEVDWVLSGVNAGGNLGADVHISGTVAAVREAAFHGRPGVALSQYRRRDRDFDWPRTANWACSVLRDLLHRPPPPGQFWNVNFPHLDPDAPEPEVVFCPLETAPLPLHFNRDGHRFRYAGDYHNRQRRPGTDVDVCFGGRIAVTLLSVG